MPLPTQIKNIRRILRKANPDIDYIDFETENGVPDPENDGEYFDWTTCLEEVSFPENIRILEYLFPNINWRLPKEQKTPKGPLKWLKIWQEGTSLCANALILVQQHKTLDKRARVLKANKCPVEYEFGRIQITVPKELIGIEAKVHIEFPNAPKIKRKSRRGRKAFDTFQF